MTRRIVDSSIVLALLLGAMAVRAHDVFRDGESAARADTAAASNAIAPSPRPGPRARRDAFRQLDLVLPTPNGYRTASGAPGAQYWQQRADYVISVEIDDREQRLVGSERITYHNHSPDPLRYLWLQLD